MRRTGGTVVCVALSFLCVASAAIAQRVASPGPEALLPAVDGKADCYQPSIAFGSDTYLVVWQSGQNEQADIVGLRLDKSAKPIDAAPFTICRAKDAQCRPRVAFAPDAKVFLVVWQDLRNGKDWDVFAARVGLDAKTPDGDGVAVASADRNQCEPAVCFDGKAFQVAWRGYYGSADQVFKGERMPAAGYAIFGARVSSDGRAMGQPVQLVKQLRGHMGAPALIRAGDGVLVAARVGGELATWRLVDGQPTSEPVAIKGGRCFDGIAMASDGKSVLAAWTSNRDAGGRSEGAANIGIVVLSGGQAGPVLPLSPMKDRPYVRTPAVAWDGTGYVAAWAIPMRDKGRYQAVYVRRLAADGAGVGGETPLVRDAASPGDLPAAASDGAGTTVLVYERHPADTANPIQIAVRAVK